MITINNIRIRYDKVIEKWTARSPTGEVIEKFDRLTDACAMAEQNQSYLTKLGKIRKYNTKE